MVKTYIIPVIVLFSCIAITPASSQENQWEGNPEVTANAFIDSYLTYDFNKPESGFRQPFLFHHNRHNEFNLNLAFMGLSIEHQKYRANVALQSGTYATDNYAAEDDVFKHVYEANIGVALNNNNSLWLDAGIFPSHLGFANAKSIDNYTLTRPLVAESSPYFLSGAKLSYEPNTDWTFALTLTNGWQRIRRVSGNSMLSYGTQVIYHPSDNFTFNWSTFIGTEDPDISRRVRYFNNLFGIFQLTEKFALIAGFDFGYQQVMKGSDEYDGWLGTVVVAHYKFHDKWRAALRAEYFDDEQQVVANTATPFGFTTTGVSANLDYYPLEKLAWRVEGRLFAGENEIFISEDSYSSSTFFITTSLAFKINKSID